VIVAVPADTPVTKPVAAFTVATAMLLLLQEPPAVPLVVNAEVESLQMFWLPLSVPAFGAAVTITVRVAVAFGQPPVPLTV
jgi:hypothetical protein